MDTGVHGVDLTAGLAGAAAARLLFDSGVDMCRVPLASDPYFEERIPGYRSLRAGFRQAARDDLSTVLRSADFVLVGGEPTSDHDPVRPDASWTDAHPDLIVVDLGAYLGDGSIPANEVLVQASSGMMWEHFTDRPLRFGVPFASYGQALLTAYGTWAALVERAREGTAQPVQVSLDQGASYFMATFWMTAEHPDPEFDKVTPKDVKHLIFRCADGLYVQFVMGVPSAVRKLYEILAIDEIVDASDRGFPKVGAPAATYFGNRSLIQQHTAKLDRDVILKSAKRVGIPAAPVLDVGDLWTHPQVAANQLTHDFENDRHLAGFIRESGRHASVGHEPAPGRRTGPLSGYQVLDFGAFVAGPYAGRLLDDLGADVVKVETLQGDPGRGTMRHFLVCQSGKRSIAFDVKAPQGQDILQRLLRSADIVLHNFRNGVDRRLGLSPEQIHQINPRTITLSSMAFGPEGPLANDPGFDPIAQALTGLESRAGGDSDEPVWYRTPYLDYTTGGLGAIALLSAVYLRLTENRVASKWVSLLNAAMFMQSDTVLTDGGVRQPRQVDADGFGTGPTERCYRTEDGWIVVSAADPSMASRLHDVVTAPGPGKLPAERDSVVVAQLAAGFALDKTSVWLERLREAGVWAHSVDRYQTPVFTRDDSTYGVTTGHLDVQVQIGEEPQAHFRPGAPRHGEHTAEVLAELGFHADQISDLRRDGVVVINDSYYDQEQVSL